MVIINFNVSDGIVNSSTGILKHITYSFGINSEKIHDSIRRHILKFLELFVETELAE
jgi:hypothetical protein